MNGTIKTNVNVAKTLRELAPGDTVKFHAVRLRTVRSTASAINAERCEKQLFVEVNWEGPESGTVTVFRLKPGEEAPTWAR